MRNLRHKRARLLPQPRQLENQYMAELAQVAEWTHRVVTKEVLAHLTRYGVYRIIQDEVTRGPKGPEQFGWGFFGKDFDRVFPKTLLKKMLSRQGQRISAFQRQAVTRQLTDALGVGFWVGRRFNEQQTSDLVDKWIGTNVDLIESIPQTYFGKVEAMVRKSVSEGMRVEELSDKIMAMGNVAQAHANLIARDQTLKLYGGLNRERQKSVGIEKYIWRGVLDEAEREMHIELEGRVITWGDPPVTNEAGDTNDPGEDYQCRCSAEPIFD